MKKAPSPLQTSSIEPSSWPEHPYRGLNFFSAKDSALYGEREDEIDDCFRLIARLRTRLLLLHGRSGTGKSSFLRAGLLPALGQQGVAFCLPGLESNSEALVIRCTGDPVARIALVLEKSIERPPILGRITLKERRLLKKLLTFEPNESRTALAARVVDALARITPKFERPLLLVIDQGEEVFSLADRRNVEARDGFFAFLEDICWQTKIGMKIVLALRTEYYGQFCDHFKLEPQSKLSPIDSGVQQYMLHGISDPDKLSSAILRPTATEKMESLGSARDHYGFSFVEELPGRIAHDLLAHCGESNTLPVLQIVCTQLFERMRSRGDSEISLEDYLQMGLVAGALDNFVESRIGSSIKDSGEEPNEQSINGWRETLGSLVAKQEGGGVTTLIVSKAKLVETAKACGLKGPLGTVIESMTRERIGLLRPITALSAGLFRPKREYSLGHDALAIALFRWAEAHEAKVEANKRSQSLTRKVQIAVLILVVMSGFGVFQLVSQRANTFAMLLALAESDRASYGQRLTLLSTSLDQAVGPARLFLDYQKPIQSLRETLERSPIAGDEGEAIGLSADGKMLAVLNGDRAVVVPFNRDTPLSPSNRTEFKLPNQDAREESSGPSNLPLASAIGFVAGLDGPVVYKAGTLFYWTDGKSRSVSLAKLLPPELLNSQLPQGIEISSGIIRVWLWRFGATEMDYMLIRAVGANSRGDADRYGVFVPSPPMKVSWRSQFNPTNSLSSPEAAYIERGHTESGGVEFRVWQFNFDKPEKQLLGKITIDTPSDANVRPADDFVRSLTFPVNVEGVVTRSERGKLEYFPGDGSPTRFPILWAMQTDPLRPGFFTMRPLLAAQRNKTDQTSWRFAWLGQNGIYTMESNGEVGRTKPVVWPPLLAGEFGIENARLLVFNSDGDTLLLVTQKNFREKIKYSLYDLSDARRDAVSGMTVPALRNESCRVAKIESAVLISSAISKLFRENYCE